MSIAFLFPGQGSQLPDMLHNLPQHPSVVATLQECSDILHTDILQLDSELALQSTVSVQLALLTAGVATARALEAEGILADAVAGLSVGAFSAAVHCNVITLADALSLVHQRASAMESLFPHAYGLAAIVGLTEQQVAGLVAVAHTAEESVYIGNINAPRQIVIAGSDAGIANVLVAATQSGATKTERLPVSVPSHCPLLNPVALELRQALATITLHPATKLYVSNVRARVLRNAESIAQDLADNIAHPVRWHDSTMVLNELGCDLFFEMPPGHTLTNLARQALPDVHSIAMSQSTIHHASQIIARVDE